MTNFLLSVIAALLLVIASPLLVVQCFIFTGHPDLVAFTRRIADAIRDGDDL